MADYYSDVLERHAMMQSLGGMPEALINVG
jgi:hypothetical protein